MGEKTHQFAALCLFLSAARCTDEGLTTLIDEARISEQGTLELPTRVFGDNPRTHLLPGEIHRFQLPLVAGASVHLRVTAATCAELAPVVFLTDADGRVLESAAGDDTLCHVGAVIQRAALEASAKPYQVLVTSLGQPGRYELNIRCADAARCTPDTSILAFHRERADADADKDTLDEAGRFMFDHVFRLADGLGNGRDRSPPPNMNAIHNGALGGPDAQSCVSCHNQFQHRTGAHGSGGRDDNIFQGGDGQNASEALVRNPPPIAGVGLRQAIARSLSEELAAQFGAMTSAGELCVQALDEPVCFGTVAVSPSGDKTFVSNFVDGDLVVRPFGWKGREATLRGFVKGGFRVHFGIQAETPIETFCALGGLPYDDERVKDFKLTWGFNLDDCLDPDEDGMARELTEGQLAAMDVYLQRQHPPPVPPPTKETEAARATFRDIGCTSCHTRGFPLAAGAYVEPYSRAFIELPGDGSPELWSDFRRHDLGSGNHEPRPFRNEPEDIHAFLFMTPPLWDLARSAPYMHDGRADTIDDAIRAHEDVGSEANAVVKLYRDLEPSKRVRLLRWLESLGL